jgi:hypothetical protein
MGQKVRANALRRHRVLPEVFLKPSGARTRHVSVHMVAILIEGVLFVALVATGAALLYFVFAQFTPAGVRLRQKENRRRIERAVALVCPVHGPRAEEDMVLLPGGGQICPDCYKEMLHD